MLNKIQFTIENEDGEESVVDLPTKFTVCPRCEGHGTHLHPDIGGHAYTSEEFNESFDYEEREEYFRHGGRYDVACEECNGLRVVSVVNEEELQQTDDGKELLKEYNKHLDNEYDYRRMCEDERRFGC